MTMMMRMALAVCLVASIGVAACEKDGTPSKAEVYCHDLIQEGCVRAFDCVPPANRTVAFLTTYGASVELCQAAPVKCAMYPATCPNFDPAASMICLDQFTTSDCSQLLFIDANGDPTIGLPSSCGAVCPASSP